jgi:sterol desaturase/sphingolipid hydroxylase (fatty acid hydroxylase superfamily)
MRCPCRDETAGKIVMELQTKHMLFVLPLMVLFALAEALWLRYRGRQAYAWRESAASLGVAIGQRVAGLATAGMMVGTLLLLWQHRVFTLPLNNPLSLPALFLGVEFFYYWHHRISHESRWFWASHAVHHSPQHFNLSAAYRLGWTGAASGAALFYAPLVLLGFHPAAVFATLTLNLLYQFWLHTTLVPTLGWFDKIFNSPSNHRVHHGVNPRYLDTNYGGVLIVFDRLFGTYMAERADEPVRYGLVKQLNSYNPFVIALHEWFAILRDLRKARSWSDALGYLFARPGWRPDGKGQTSADLKRAAHAAQTTRSTQSISH